MFRKKRKFGLPPLDFNLSQVDPLPYAFAHNDSVYNSPLFDALRLGYCFIEADVHLIENEIFVYHRKPFFLNTNKTLTNCYLQPLFEIFKKNDSIFPKLQKPICLILDIKTDPEKTYLKLKSTLQPFKSMLTSWENGRENPKGVSIILSGNRPLEMVLSENKRSVAIDGRLIDIGKDYPTSFMPMISDKYSKIFGWSFFSKKPSSSNLFQLQRYSNQIHKEDKLFRLWGIPEKATIWKSLLENGLDLISTDQIKNLKEFCLLYS